MGHKHQESGYLIATTFKVLEATHAHHIRECVECQEKLCVEPDCSCDLKRGYQDIKKSRYWG